MYKRQTGEGAICNQCAERNTDFEIGCTDADLRVLESYDMQSDIPDVVESNARVDIVIDYGNGEVPISARCVKCWSFGAEGGGLVDIGGGLYGCKGKCARTIPVEARN